MSRFTLSPLPLEGLTLVQRHPIGDARGFFVRLFCADELAAAGWRKPVAQVNQTYSARKGTVRGMHFQRGSDAEMKLVTCLRGAVWDVAVDIRPASATYLQWHAEELSAANGRSLLIPEGFAHGFQSLTDDVELLYCHSAPHAPASEDGLNPNDAALRISWPLAITEISERDATRPHMQTRAEPPA